MPKKIYIKFALFFIIYLSLFPLIVYSEDDMFAEDIFSAENMFDDEALFDESAMFGDVEETVVASDNIVNKESISLDNDAKTVTFTGELQAVSTYSIDRDYLLEDGDFDDNEFENYLTANFLLDVRLKKNIKGFANIQVDYYPNAYEETSTVSLGSTEVDATTEVNTDYSLKEIFVDVNNDRKVYYRIGKQVLQWGRGYLWNPTDLINIDKKSFLDDDTDDRDGVYGLKAHIPDGAEKNYYVFIDSTDADNIDEFGGAVKYEFLVENTEMAVSAWAKKGYNAVLGYDVSKRLNDIDFIGEISLSDGANQTKFKVVDGTLVEYEESGIIPQVTVGFTKTFDYKDENDKVSFTGEFFYNHGGYEENIFADDTEYVTDISVETITTESDGTLTLETIDNYEMTIAEALVYKDYYETNMLSKYYAAFFTSINEFTREELTLNINWIGNLNDHSSILSTGISYADINDLSMSLILNSYLGPDDAEYTTAGLGAYIEFVLGISF